MECVTVMDTAAVTRLTDEALWIAGDEQRWYDKDAGIQEIQPLPTRDHILALCAVLGIHRARIADLERDLQAATKGGN